MIIAGQLNETRFANCSGEMTARFDPDGGRPCDEAPA